MNKYNSESYADQFTPFKAHKYSERTREVIMSDKLMTRDVGIVCMSIEPTSLMRSQPDCCVLTEKEEFSLMMKRLHKKM